MHLRLGLIGLGRMGLGMARRLHGADHEIVGFDIDDGPLRRAVEHGVSTAPTLEKLVSDLEPPRAIWTMVPAGAPTEETIAALAGLLHPGDTIVDGANSHYKDSLQRAATLADAGIDFVDVGVSGGIWGLEEGFCLMIGAEPEVFSRLDPIFASLASEEGYARVGPPGSGHFAKMVHNGIEYAMLQAYGEGFELLGSPAEFSLDLHQIAELWRHGSVVRSWLLDLLESALAKDPRLESVDDWVDDSGEGRWAVQDAVDRAVPVPAIAYALFQRFASRQEHSMSSKIIAALRHEFGGHEVRGAD